MFCSAIQKKIKDRINVVVVTKGKFLHKQRMKFRRKWAEYDSTSSSSDDDDDDEQEEEEDQENEEKNAGEEEEDPELVGKQLLEEMNELGEEGNEEEDEEEEQTEKKPEELYDPDAEDEKVARAWYHWSNERGPTANQDYQREIEERGINQLLETLKGPGTPGEVVSYSHGGEYGRLEQVGVLSVFYSHYNLSLYCKDWRESHAAYKVLESKRNPKVLLKSISKTHFGVSK